MDATLTPERARRLQRDGYLTLRRAVPDALVLRARRLLFQRMGRLQQAAVSGDADQLAAASRLLGRSGGDAAFMDLLAHSTARTVLEAAFDGPLREVRGAQLATLFPAEDDRLTNEAGYHNVETPHFGWCGHLDGLWNGGIATPPAGVPMSVEDEARWYADPSTNGGQREYPPDDDGNRANIANFAALVGVALSDQRAMGSGNLGVLRGAHRHIEAFFRWQHERGGPLGPDGPGWPRVHVEAPNGHGLVHYPPRVRARYRRAAAITHDGHSWPRPTFVRLRPGDAVIVHWATPHSASRVMTSDPRMMVYFRIWPASRPQQRLRVHVPAMLDNWLEWPGLRALLA